MTRLFDHHPTIQSLILAKQDLVLLFNHPFLTIPTCKIPLDPFMMSKFPFEYLLLLFGTLSKNATLSFMGYLLPRHSISRTIGYVYRLSRIDISLMANHPILHHHHHLLSDYFVLPPSLFLFYAHIEGNV